MLFCVQFSIIANAGSTYNLINPNLTTWDNLYPDTTIVSKFSSNPDIYRVLFKPELSESTQLNIRFGSIYSLEGLTTGNTYSFNFKIEDYNTINSIISHSESYFYGFQRYDGGLVVGLASYNYDLDIIEPVTDCYVQITKDNYKSFFGKDTTINFELGNVTNPCLFIYYVDANVGGNPVPFYFSNVSLIDNDAEKEDGFLSKLFAWFQEKFDAIGESFSNLANEIKQGFTDLKNDLINGIKSLFVPDEQFMEEYSNRWDELIHTRLGAVAQVSGVLYDFFESILDYSGGEQNTISVPAVTLPLPDNASFTFGGFDVEIVNEKFVFLQNAVKVLVGILATFGFIYGLRNRYDEIMGVEH